VTKASGKKEVIPTSEDLIDLKLALLTR